MSDDRDAARRFESEHAHYRADLAYWIAAARRCGSPVLELGAATGRVARAVARATRAEVWALDRSPAMLEELERLLSREPETTRARVRPVAGDMRQLALGRRFPLVLAPMNTLQVLTDPDDRRSCFAGIAAHLEPGGELCFDVALPDEREILGSLGVERRGGCHRDPRRGTVMAHSAWYDAFDPETSTLWFTLRVVEAGGGRSEERLRRHCVHLYSPGELEQLLTDSGLRPIAVGGDFSGSPLRGGERQVYRCRRA